MIKTHKPRGHIWTHASDFQRTKEFRNIKYEECIATTESDHTESSSRDAHRLSKRRRIEKLADDFLNGVPLVISSARPCPQVLKSAVIRTRRPLSDSKFAWPNVKPVKEPLADSPVWEDHENEAETLARLRRRRTTTLTLEESREKAHDEGTAGPRRVREIEEVRARCGSARRPKPVKLCTDPSDDALRRAAALRARRLQRANSELPVIPDSLSLETDRARTDIEPRSEPCYEALAGSRRSSQWLSRRKSRFQFVEDDGLEDSIDELQRSAIKTSITRSGKSHPSPEEDPIPRLHENSAEPYCDLNEVQVPDDPTHSNGRSSEKASYHTAREATEGELELSNAQSIRVESPNIVTYVSGQAVVTNSEPSDEVLIEARRPRSAGNATPQQSFGSRTRSAALRPMQNSANPSSSDVLHTAHAVQSAPGRLGYTAAQASQNGRSPFPYRKGRLRSRETSAEPETIPAKASGSHRARAFGYLEEPVEVSASRSNRKHVATGPSTLDMSFEHDSSFAPKLTMALVDEHLNSILPSDPNSTGKTSAVKRAIRRELRNSGAEITRCDSEPPPTSQIEGDAQLDPQDNKEVEHVVDSVQAILPDTQFMLRKAHKDLFESPERQDLTNIAITSASPQTSSPNSRTGDTTREPLKRLSQEPMPSTQQILGDFEGWSTVKKPRTANRSSPDPTPTASKKSAWTAINSTKDTPTHTEASMRKGATDRRRSSLRFAVASASPNNDSTFEDSPAPIHSTHSRANSSLTDLRTPVSILKPSRISQSEETQRSVGAARRLSSYQSTSTLETHQSFISAPEMSSYQAAQVQPALLNDISNLSQTVDDLTRDLFDGNELGGVFSQVG